MEKKLEPKNIKSLEEYNSQNNIDQYFDIKKTDKKRTIANSIINFGTVLKNVSNFKLKSTFDVIDLNELLTNCSLL